MSTIIKKDFTFLAAIHFENKFLTNLYEISATMKIETFDAKQQNIAIERMIYFFQVLEDCIFIQDSEKEAIEKYTEAGIRVCIVPEEPYDQILGLILLNKCNAIMENRIIVTNFIIGSKLSNLIKFDITDEMASNEFTGKHWWNDSSLNLSNKSKKKDKIVKLSDYKDDWAEVDLTWKSK